MTDTIYIQKKKTSTGDTYPASGSIDVYSTFGIIVNSLSFPDGGTKEPYKNNWKDENGEETYIPDTLKVEAYDLKLQFAWKGSLGGAYTAYKNFAAFLTGRDGNGADLSIYDDRTKWGRTKIWYKEPSNPDFHYDNVHDILTWEATFRVTDPVTEFNPLA